jgi:uncharacterized protein (TIGR03067 family)
MKPDPTTAAGADDATPAPEAVPSGGADETRQDAGASPPAAPGDDLLQDLERFQGTWATAAMVIDGRTLPEVALRQRRIIVIDDRYAVVDENRTLRRGAFRIDPAATPRRIDFQPADGPAAGLVNHGIYEFSGDLLRICYAPPGAPRPEVFASVMGSGRTLVTDRKEPPAMMARVSPAIVVAADRSPDHLGLHITRVHHRDLPEVCGKGHSPRDAAVSLLQHLLGEAGAMHSWHRERVEQVIAEVRAFLDHIG